MAISRTRARSGDTTGESRLASERASPEMSPPAEAPSPNASEEIDASVTKRKSVPRNDMSKNKRSTPSIDREDGFGLWKPVEIDAIAKEVVAKKSVDTSKLFSAVSSGPLPEPLSNRTKAETISLVDRLKASYNSSVASWAPKCGVQELLSALASESYFVSASMEKLDPLCADFDKIKGDCSTLFKLCVDTSGKSKKLHAQVAVEMKLRDASEASRLAGEDSAKGVRKTLETIMEERGVLEENLNNVRLNELEIRRRLDRSRLKVAALRGEMIISTVDELSRAPPKWMIEVGESVTSAESDAASMEVGKNSNRSSGFSSINGDAPKCNVDKDGDAAMEEGNVTSEIEGKPESVDIEVALPGTHVDDGDAAEEDQAVEDDDDTGFDEDAVSMELRLLKYRLDMYVSEADEWRRSFDAERVRIAMVTKAKTRLEEELVRYRAPRGTGTSAAKSRARRPAPAPVEIPAELPKSKRRKKSHPHKSLSKPIW